MKTRRKLADRLGATGMMLAAGLGLHLRAQAPAAAGAGPWIFSGSVMQGYDSNPLMLPGAHSADSTTTVSLDLGGHWAGPRWSFDANYAPEGEAYLSNSKLDFVAQSYTQSWNYALGPHTQFSWSANAEDFPERGGAPMGMGGAVAVANASQAMALATVMRQAGTTIGLTYQSSERVHWSGSATGSLQGFSQDRALVALEPGLVQSEPNRTRSAGGNLGWNYELNPDRNLQIGVGDTEMWLLGLQHTRYINLQTSLTQKFGGFMTVQVGAGPAWNWTYNLGPANAPALPGHTYAGSANLSAAWGHSSYSVLWSHSDQLGLTPGSLTTNIVGLQWTESWTSSWQTSVSVGQSLGTSGGLSPASSLDNLDSLYSSAQMSLRLAPGWALFANVIFNDQNEPFYGITGNLRRVQAGMGLTYQSSAPR